jgi:hypothetical protein
VRKAKHVLNGEAGMEQQGHVKTNGFESFGSSPLTQEGGELVLSFEDDGR